MVSPLPLQVGEQRLDSEILITPDLNGLIIGIDWFEKQGQFVCDVGDVRLRDAHIYRITCTPYLHRIYSTF